MMIGVYKRRNRPNIMIRYVTIITPNTEFSKKSIDMPWGGKILLLVIRLPIKKFKDIR